MVNEPTVKCPNCQSDAEELATGFYHCPSCGAIFGEAVNAKGEYEPAEAGPPPGFDFSGVVRRILANPKPVLIIVAVAIGAAVLGIASFLGSATSEDETEPAPEPRVAEERTEVNEPYAVVAPDGVTLYAEPDLWSSRIGTIPEDEVITVIEKRQYWWRIVRADTSSGWALNRFEDFEEFGPAGPTEKNE
jgi:hypothetical protein